jgi:hypothetical protein
VNTADLDRIAERRIAQAGATFGLQLPQRCDEGV